VVNLKVSLLEHAHLLLHELTHYFHDCIGERRTPKLTQVYKKAKAVKKEMKEAFQGKYDPKRYFSENFEYTMSCPEEFLAYMIEAYYSQPDGNAILTPL